MCGSEGSRIGQREKLGCAAVATAASAGPQRSSGAGMIQSEAGGQAFVASISHSQGTDCNLGQATCFMPSPCW